MIVDTDDGLFGVSAGAAFDPDRVYRYRLWRQWGPAPRMLWCMLNPSVADAFILDNTLRKCVKFAKREGCGGVELVNLFAIRGKDPKVIRQVTDPIGPENDQAILDAIADAQMIVCGWGNHGRRKPWKRDEAVLAMFEAASIPTFCFELNNNGSPQHPLYILDEAPLLEYSRGCLV